MEVELVSNEPAPVAEPSSEEVIPAPEATPEAPAPEATPEVVPETTPEEKLYPLPDGRLVTADKLQEEWTNNFLPEFTRKSQRLAQLERGGDPELTRDPNLPEWQQPDYVPKTYGELVELATKEALHRITSTQQEEAQRAAALTAEVESQITEIKAKDPKLDENALFQHANKYGFRDLRLAYDNMSEIHRVRNDTEQTVTKNILKRQADPIAAGHVPSSGDTTINPKDISQFSSALDYFRRNK